MRGLLFILMLTTIVTGCSHPIVLYEDRLYAGFLTNKKIVYENGEYNSLKGVGINLGLLAFGFGYYDLQYLRVDKRIAGKIDSPLATVFIGYERDPFNYIFIGGKE